MTSADSLRLTETRRLILGLIVGLLVLAGVMVLSIGLGTADIRPAKVWDALVAFDGSYDHLIIRNERLPRMLIAVAVGASLAAAGALMQGLTRNPLASPSLLGVNAGAVLAVVGTLYITGSRSSTLYTWAAFLGAALAAGAVYVLGSGGRSGLTPVRLTLAGAALTALLSALTTAVLVVSERTLDEIRFWLAGSVAGRDLDVFLQVAPYIAGALVVAVVLGRQITVLSLGEDVARGLGQQTVHVKLIAAACVVVLAGGSVAAAGPIAFVGLVIPHVVRFFVGPDYRWILPYSAVLGAVFLLVADVGARLVIKPQELPVGIMTALVGGPFFVYLAWWKVRR